MYICNILYVILCSFDEAQLSETLRENVRKAKYEKPTPIQKWAIPTILDGRDLMGCAQTGSGKTVSPYHVTLLDNALRNCQD